jgi:diguanylate cyclase (GGDEF)-like protein/PAS domain S-box-containing protein
MSGLSEPRIPDDSRQPATSGVRGILELTQLVRQGAAAAEVPDAVASAVAQSLGFAVVAVNLYRPESGDYEVGAVHGGPSAADAASALEGVLDLATAPPAGSKPAWRSEDALFARVDGAGGRHFGIIVAREPVHGRRPGDHELEALSALAAHAALALESANRLAELRSALARSRAVLDSSPDAVIAIDRQGRVVDFNPAAERTFGLGRVDALDRDLAELIIPPEHREAHRRGFARALADDWRLLGRRIETTALRADGSRLPVELALSLVDGAEDGGPFVYGFVRDISERRRGEEQLAYLAYHDPLTGLPNRILIEQQLDLALARARRRRGAVVLMFVDLDDFKEVNDRLGHAAGDRLLAAVATRLDAVLRDSDLLARQGGDEFIVLLSDIDEDPHQAAELVAGKLLDTLREPFVVAGAELRTGASIGISVYPEDAADTETLLRHADVAMYGAKSAGGGQLAFHRSSGEIQSRRTSVSTQLRRAIGRSELELHYQPIWRLGDPLRIAGVEALLRWRHPDRGLLAPEAFIGMAEQSAAGDELLDWSVGEACRQVQDWERDGLRPRVSINVSPQQLLGPGFAARFDDQLRSRGLGADRFMIELTESAWTVDAAETLTVIAELRAKGVRLAIDDFGAGYSSLSRLRGLRFDVIKIDRELLVDVPGDEAAIAILRAILDLAQACGASIIAEGIEHDAQLTYLTACGIGEVQGYLLGHPVPAQEVTPQLAQRLIDERAPA